ncbi:MAG TPA: bifunctional oligoribonuclease/PAP phosphatase NrnA [Planctomycetaceae bacterium]|nr:bifunctional oligoribonuclease/PAP phosphatase NrnA [Planctomycetaceae bacterium]
MSIHWEPFRHIVESNRRFVLTSHVRPDADAVGSELALAAMLEDQGKSVRIVNPSDLPEHLKFLDPDRRVMKIGQGVTPDEAADTDVHVVLDTSAWTQLQDVTPVFRRTAATKVVIDHHASADDLGAIEFKDVQAEATGALVFRMAELLGWPIPERAVTPLYCAIATDTGWFRFPSTTGDTMRIAGRLVDLGAQPHLIYQSLYEQYSAARVRLAGRVLSRLGLDCGDRLAYITATQDDFRGSGARQADTEDLVNECLRIRGTECAFIAIEQMNGTIKVSLRSRTELDVARVAEQFGGGGHRQASGAVLPGPLAAALSRVLEALRAALNGRSEAGL